VARRASRPGPPRLDSARLDSAHLAAARLLASGDTLGALSALSGREDAHALALQGIALAQLGEAADARALLERAARGLRHGAAVHRARALAAAGEVAASQRDFRAADALLVRAVAALRASGDRRNAAWALVVHARLCALRGAARRARALLAAAGRALPAGTDATLRSGLALARTEERLRRADLGAAAAALAREAERGSVLAGELAAAAAALTRPVARAHAPRTGRTEELDGPALARLCAGTGPRRAPGTRRVFLVDSLQRRCLFAGGRALSLARRPVLFALLARLARAWPEAVPWRTLARDVFGLTRADDSARLRSKVEIDRLRRILPARARIAAATNAWRLVVPPGSEILWLEPLAPDARAGLEARIEAFLADGVVWSARDLAVACGTSASSLQRALRALVRGGRVDVLGRARARRYTATAPAGIASQMLLVGLSQPARG
jgi:hypothetical protein